ncbi:MAG TPA: hypothetical protein ENN84_06480 [Candidatus Marinimicrobia bacterium]|nr:hypothetical protein [Candidatus Neomarinimicrobiota bacterium]
MTKKDRILLVWGLILTLVFALSFLGFTTVWQREKIPDQAQIVYQSPILIDTRGPFPQITADCIRDHYFAEGYLHAMYGYSEMIKLRAIIQGNFSEMAAEKYLSLDKNFFLLNISHKAKEILRLLSPDEQAFLSDFSRGVNHWAESNRLSFRLRKIQPEPWKAEHSLAILLFKRWQNSAPMEKDLFINELGRYYGKNAVGELIGAELDSLPFPKVNTLPILSACLQNSQFLEEVLSPEPPIRFWTIFSPKKHIDQGLSILHLEYEKLNVNQHSLIMETHIDGQKIWGKSLLGIPGFWSGKSESRLWAISPGYINWELESLLISPDGEYFWIDKEWRPFQIIQDKNSHKIRKESANGTLLSYQWDTENQAAQYGLLLRWHPEDDTNILPFSILNKDDNSYFTSRFTGWVFDSEKEVLSYNCKLDPSDSSNQMISRPVSQIQNPLVLILPGNIAQSLAENPLSQSLNQALADEGNFDLTLLKRLQLEQLNPACAEIIESFSHSVSDSLIKSHLLSWDFTERAGSIVPRLLHTYIYSLLEVIFADDMARIAPFLMEIIGRDPMWAWELIQRMLANPYSIWWDDLGKKLAKPMALQLDKAAEMTLESISRERGSDITEWQWDKGRKGTGIKQFSGSPFSPAGQFFDYRSPDFRVYASFAWALMGTLNQSINIGYADLNHPSLKVNGAK